MGETKNEKTTPETSVKESKKSEAKTPFFKGVKAEFSKIIWPNKATVTKETIAVVLTSVVIGVIIYVADILFKFGISLIV